MSNGLRIYVDDTFKTGSILSSDVTGDLVIPAIVTNNGNEYKITDIDSYAFRNQSTLSSVKIEGTNLKTIGDGAFSTCTSLTSVTLPSTVTAIDANAFYSCTALKEFHNRVTSPITIVANVFYKAQTGTLFVPKGTLAAY